MKHDVIRIFVGLYSTLIKPIKISKERPVEKIQPTMYIMNIPHLNYTFNISWHGLDMVHADLLDYYQYKTDDMNFIYWLSVIWFHSNHELFNLQVQDKAHRRKGKQILGSELTRCIRDTQ